MPPGITDIETKQRNAEELGLPDGWLAYIYVTEGHGTTRRFTDPEGKSYKCLAHLKDALGEKFPPKLQEVLDPPGSNNNKRNAAELGFPEGWSVYMKETSSGTKRRFTTPEGIVYTSLQKLKEALGEELPPKVLDMVKNSRCRQELTNSVGEELPPKTQGSPDPKSSKNPQELKDAVGEELPPKTQDSVDPKFKERCVDPKSSTNLKELKDPVPKIWKDSCDPNKPVDFIQRAELAKECGLPDGWHLQAYKGNKVLNAWDETGNLYTSMQSMEAVLGELPPRLYELRKAVVFCKTTDGVLEDTVLEFVAAGTGTPNVTTTTAASPAVGGDIEQVRERKTKRDKGHRSGAAGDAVEQGLGNRSKDGKRAINKKRKLSPPEDVQYSTADARAELTEALFGGDSAPVAESMELGPASSSSSSSSSNSGSSEDSVAADNNSPEPVMPSADLQVASAPVSVAVAPPPSSVWEKHFSNDFGIPFWFNRITQDSVWEDPG